MARRVLLRTAAGAAPALGANHLLGRPASRGAIAVGALLGSALVEVPAVGGASVALAGLGAVAAPRVRRDHVAGAVGGAVAAVVTLGAFPRVQDQPARAIAVAERRRVDPLADGTGLVVVVNPGSGAGSAPELVDHLAAALPSAEIRCCDQTDDLVETLTAAASGCRALGVVGGDGSVNGAARVALDAGVPLAVFPGGTLNHFARDLGLDSVDDAIEAVRDGQVVAIDVATIADRTFVNNASVGAYSALVDERERLEARWGKWPAMLLALGRVLRRSERFEVVLDGEPRTVWMVFFGNCEYEPAGFAPAERPDLVDGLLDVRLIDAGPPLSRARLISALLLGALARSRVYERRVVPSISVRCGDGTGRTRLAADGETFDGPAAFVVRKRPAALLVHMVEPGRDDRA